VKADRRRVVVHVGCPKTGTTFLQTTLWRSREALRTVGVELPVDRLSHFHLALAIRGQLDPELDAPRAFRATERISSALAESTAETILLSNETLAGATVEQASTLRDLIASAVDRAEVHVVITARDLARQVPAEWQQQIQQRRTVAWDDFLRSLRDGTDDAAYFLPTQDAADIARRWGAGLPAHRIHIVTVPRPSDPRTWLLRRFCRVLEVDPAVLDDGVAAPNESLGSVQVELLRRVNVALGERLPHPRAGFGRVGKRHLAQRILAPMGGERPRLPHSMMPWCEKHTERLIADIDGAGYDVVGDIDELRPDPTATAGEDLGVDDTVIAAAAVDVIAELIDQRQRDLEHLDRLRQRLRTQARG
jgi:hypothetical protein